METITCDIMLRFSVDMSVPVVQGMANDILKEITTHMLNTLNATIPFITRKIEDLVSAAIRDSEVADEVEGGQLEDILCMPNGREGIEHAIQAILGGMRIDRKPIVAGLSGITGGYAVNLLDDSYNDILSGGSVSYITLNGVRVPWMEWLLTRGTSSLIYKGKLLKTQRGVLLVGAQQDLTIPSNYAGINSDNFITRALKPLEPKIGQIIEEEVSRRS